MTQWCVWREGEILVGLDGSSIKEKCFTENDVLQT